MLREPQKSHLTTSQAVDAGDVNVHVSLQIHPTDCFGVCENEPETNKETPNPVHPKDDEKEGRLDGFLMSQMHDLPLNVLHEEQVDHSEGKSHQSPVVRTLPKSKEKWAVIEEVPDTWDWALKKTNVSSSSPDTLLHRRRPTILQDEATWMTLSQRGREVTSTNQSNGETHERRVVPRSGLYV